MMYTTHYTNGRSKLGEIGSFGIIQTYLQLIKTRREETNNRKEWLHSHFKKEQDRSRFKSYRGTTGSIKLDQVPVSLGFVSSSRWEM